MTAPDTEQRVVVRWGGNLRSLESIEKFRAHSRARQRSLATLAGNHRDEFLALAAGGDRSQRDAAERAIARNHPEEFSRLFEAEKALAAAETEATS